jgi:sulfate/thiosulfate transport system ATP-binding protein
MSISIRNVTKRFGQFLALDDVSVDVPEGSLIALLGPSGCGKTTLLRIIAGLEHPDEGTVLAREDDVTNRSARDRNIGFVFQHYALFRHLNVFENVAFALRVRGWKNGAVKARVDELLSLVRLDGLENRLPAQLSGGQRQRVALARALAAQPRVLLLDEPFGALDAKVRQELRRWLRRLHDELHVTSIFVTHDQEEAFEVADRVVVMNRGRVEQIGTPEEIFDHPANAFVMDFLGNVNVFHGRIHDGKAFLGEAELPYPESAHLPPQSAQLYVRPHELDIVSVPEGPGSLPARVVHINPIGSYIRVQIRLANTKSEVNVDVSPRRYAELRLQRGQEVYVTPQRIRMFADFGSGI